jgi:hypothetical protein
MGSKVLLAALVAISLSPLSIGSATAEGGCGPGFHRGPYGGCRPNRGPIVVVPGAAVVAPAPVVCGAGFRWHPRFRRCVVL